MYFTKFVEEVSTDRVAWQLQAVSGSVKVSEEGCRVSGSGRRK